MAKGQFEITQIHRPITKEDSYAETLIRAPQKERCKKIYILIIFVILVLVVGIVLIILANTKTCQNENVKKSVDDICGPSEEGNRIKLNDFILKMQDLYYKIYPNRISLRPGVADLEIREKFRIFDPRPKTLKKNSDVAKRLLKQLTNMNPDFSKLTQREHRTYLQTEHFLKYGRFVPNYDLGLWMLGPSSFCNHSPICNLQDDIITMETTNIVTKEDVFQLEKLFEDYKKSIYSHIDILRLGIQSGMVRSQSECVSGLHTVKMKYKEIINDGPNGIIIWAPSFYSEHYYSNILQNVNEKFVQTFGKDVKQYIGDLVVPLLGKPLHDLLRYLEDEYSLYCRPKNVGPGGLSALPLEFIWYNGTKTQNKTHPFLPYCTGSNCRLNGSEAYEKMLGLYTTTDIHPDKVYELGWQNLNKLYPQVLELARKITGKNQTDDAVVAFKNILDNHSLSYFNDQPLPENETRGDAFKYCSNIKDAKMNCPNRWKAMEKWMDSAYKIMSILEANTVDFFYFTGNRKTTPSCPMKLSVDFHPTSGVVSYFGTDSVCSHPATYKLPFFLENLGPTFMEYSLNAHEARPGHHTQVQGYYENFMKSCDGPGDWLGNQFYLAYTEGWGLYAENPLIAQDTSIYNDKPMQKFGMLRLQIWRALRLIVDTGLHYKKMTQQQALDLFAKYAWDTTDLSRKEVVRYQSNYGQATSYMIGQLEIWRLRNHTKEMLGDDFSLKEFHMQVLSIGSSPLAYLDSYVKQYITCKKNPSSSYCDQILNPTRKPSTSKTKMNFKKKRLESQKYWSFA